MGKIRNFLERIGYFCPGCNRYIKTFAPPFGRRVCLACQLADAEEHKAELDDIILQRRFCTMPDAVLQGRLGYLRGRFLPSKEERREKRQAQRK